LKADGNKYYGNWRNGKFDGLGVLRLDNGDFYEGEWLNGLKHG